MSLKKKALLIGYEDFEQRYTDRFGMASKYYDHEPSEEEIEAFLDENPMCHHVSMARYWEKQNWESPAVHFDWDSLLVKAYRWMEKQNTPEKQNSTAVYDLHRLFKRYQSGERSEDLFYDLADSFPS